MTDNLELEKTLWQGRYIDSQEVVEDGIAFDDKMQMLSLQMQKANELKSY